MSLKWCLKGNFYFRPILVSDLKIVLFDEQHEVYKVPAVKFTFFPLRWSFQYPLPQILQLAMGAAQISLQDWRTYSLSCSECCQWTSHSRQLSFRMVSLLCPRSYPFPMAACLQWRVNVWYKGLAPLPQLRTTLKGHPSVRACHGVGWGFHGGCIKGHLLLIPLVPFLSLPFHRHCFQQHFPLKSQPANLHLRGHPWEAQPATKCFLKIINHKNNIWPFKKNSVTV